MSRNRNRGKSLAKATAPEDKSESLSKMKMKTFRSLALFAAMCAASNVNAEQPITQAKVSQIHPGQTTEANLVSLFGSPTTAMTDFRHNRSLSWVYTPPATIATYLPLGGMFGGLDVHVQELWVVLGSRGTVRNYFVRESNFVAKTTAQSTGYEK